MTTTTERTPSPGTTGSTADDSAARAASRPPTRPGLALPTIYTGSFSAFTGLSIADVVYPLLVLGLTGKPLLAGLFGAVQFTALVLCALPAGSFADRHDRRRILICSESVRALLSAVLAVTLASGHFSLFEVYLIAAVLGACQPFSGVRTLALRKIAPADRLIKVLSVQQAVSAAAQLIGPGIGTLLYSVNRSLPFAAIAAGMAVSALCAFLVRFDGRPEPAPAPAPATTTTTATASETPADGESEERKRNEGAFSGLRIVWGHPVMRATMIFIMLFNLIAVPLDLVVIVQVRHEGIPTRYLGLILACTAVGALLGTPLIPRLHAMLRPGRLLAFFGVVVSSSCLAMALPSAGILLAAGLTAIGFVIPAAAVLVNVLILQQVPDHQRGRVLGAVNAMMALGAPLGAAFGGTLLQAFSPDAVFYGTAAALGCVTLYAFAQRDLRHADWPPESEQS